MCMPAGGQSRRRWLGGVGQRLAAWVLDRPQLSAPPPFGVEPLKTLVAYTVSEPSSSLPALDGLDASRMSAGTKGFHKAASLAFGPRK